MMTSLTRIADTELPSVVQESHLRKSGGKASARSLRTSY